MENIAEFLERNGIRFIRRDVKTFSNSGARINIPKGLRGSVLIIQECEDQVDMLNMLTSELYKYIHNCEQMRNISKDVLLPCSSVIDFDANGRNNKICNMCPFGKKIKILTAEIKMQYIKATEDVSKEYFDDKPEK